MKIEVLRQRYRGLRAYATEVHQEALALQAYHDRTGTPMPEPQATTYKEHIAALEGAMAVVAKAGRTGSDEVPVWVTPGGAPMCTEPKVLRRDWDSCHERACRACFHQSPYVRSALLEDGTPRGNCDRCNGTGYIPIYDHVEDGVCFTCGGTKNS
jgi:hypothetical protein